jgi:hypothetical protein
MKQARVERLQPMHGASVAGKRAGSKPKLFQPRMDIHPPQCCYGGQADKHGFDWPQKVG